MQLGPTQAGGISLQSGPLHGLSLFLLQLGPKQASLQSDPLQGFSNASLFLLQAGPTQAGGMACRTSLSAQLGPKQAASLLVLLQAGPLHGLCFSTQAGPTQAGGMASLFSLLQAGPTQAGGILS